MVEKKIDTNIEEKFITQEYDDGFVVSINFMENGRSYYFYSPTGDLEKGTKVIVETIRGVELGEVVKEPLPLDEVKLRFPLKPILRRANKEDINRYEENKELAKDAFIIAKEAIENQGLDMRLLMVDYVLDASKVVIIYSSDNRVDFRDLLKDLAAKLRCRIELRQIGSRDRSKLVGGLGICGLPLCCSTFLEEFDGISINMAKNQFLALNIQKLSGACGKLLCCLKYENDQYSAIRKGLPKIGLRVKYENENYKITNINILTHQVRLESSDSIRMVSLKQMEEIIASQKKEG